MEFLAEILRVIGEMFGLTGLILILATIAVVAAIYYNRRNGGQAAGHVVAAAATPITCKWSDHDAKSLAAALKSIDEMKANQERIWRDQDSLREKVTMIEVQTRR